MPVARLSSCALLFVFLPSAAQAWLERVEIGRLTAGPAEGPVIAAEGVRLAHVRGAGGSGAVLTVARLADTASAPRFAPVSLELHLEPSATGHAFAGALRFRTLTLLEVRGAIGGDGLRVDFSTPELVFGEPGIRFDQLVPASAALVRSAGGRLQLLGRIRRNRERIELAELALDDWQLELGGVTLSGLTARIAFDALLPPRTLPAQKLHLARVEAGLSMGPGEVVFRLDAGRLLVVERAQLAVAGGILATPGFTLDLAAPRAEIPATLRAVDVAALLDGLAVDGLSGSGRLRGHGTLRLDPEGGLEAAPLVLLAEDGGVLRYRPPDGSTPADPQLALLYRALENFHYERLEATLEGPFDGELRLRLSLRGANPDLYGGYPVALNLDFSGPLGRILQRGVRSYRLPESIERQIRERLR